MGQFLSTHLVATVHALVSLVCQAKHTVVMRVIASIILVTIIGTSLLVGMQAAMLGSGVPLQVSQVQKPAQTPKVTRVAPTTHVEPSALASPDRTVAVARPKGALAGRIVALDAGHGGMNPGAKGLLGSYEEDNTLATVYQIKHQLEQAGAQVVLTRWGNEEPGITPGTDPADLETIIAHRARMASHSGAEVLVSIHNDSNQNRLVTGTTTYYWNSPILGAKIQSSLVAQLGSKNLGVVRSDFYLLTYSSIPAVLVEVGFISNQQEEQRLRSAWYQEQVGIGISAGLQQYFNQFGATGRYNRV